MEHGTSARTCASGCAVHRRSMFCHYQLRSHVEQLSVRGALARAIRFAAVRVRVTPRAGSRQRALASRDIPPAARARAPAGGGTAVFAHGQNRGNEQQCDGQCLTCRMGFGTWTGSASVGGPRGIRCQQLPAASATTTRCRACEFTRACARLDPLCQLATPARPHAQSLIDYGSSWQSVDPVANSSWDMPRAPLTARAWPAPSPAAELVVPNRRGGFSTVRCGSQLGLSAS